MGFMRVIAQNCYFSANQKAERLHGASVRFRMDVQSPLHRASHTMKNRKKNNNRKKVAQAQQNNNPKPKKSTPFSDVGGIVGSRLGSMFGVPYLKGVGKWLGTGIGSIFGSGDYEIVGGPSKYNVLMNGAQIPQFSSTKASNIVCHREYLGDINASTAFTNLSYQLNPGLAATFPWLSAVAQNYQEYRFHGLIFEFRSLLTDFVPSGSPGVVVMATNYNSDSPPFSTKQEMENSEYAVSVKPTVNLIHGVECATNQTVLPQLYVRTGAPTVGVDLKTTDLGRFQLATQRNPVGVTLGELWVSYCVEFFKPILPVDVGPGVGSFHAIRATASAANPLGSIGVSTKGDLPTIVTPVSITSAGQPGNFYMINVSWTGTVFGPITYPVLSYVQCTPMVFFDNLALPNVGPTVATNTFDAIMQIVVRADHDAGGSFTVNFGVAGTYPTGTTGVDVLVTQVSGEAVE